MKLLRPLCLILLGLGLCQCRMDPFSTFSHDNGGDVPKVPTVRVPLSDNFYDSNGAVLPLGTAISDGFELSVVPDTPIDEIKAMFENKAAEILELSVVGPTGEILADGENIDQSIANGASIELVFTDSSGGSLRITVTGSLELQERIEAEAQAKAKAELAKLKDTLTVSNPAGNAVTSAASGNQLTYQELGFVRADLLQSSGATLHSAATVTFEVKTVYASASNAIVLKATLVLKGATPASDDKNITITYAPVAPKVASPVAPKVALVTSVTDLYENDAKSTAAKDIKAGTTYYVDSATTIGDIKAKLVATDSTSSKTIDAVVAAVVGKGPTDTKDGTEIGAVKAITLTYTDSTGGEFVVTVEGSAASLKVAQAAETAGLTEEGETKPLQSAKDVRHVTRFTIPMPSGTSTLPSNDKLKQFFTATGPDGKELLITDFKISDASTTPPDKLTKVDDFVVIGFNSSTSGGIDVFNVTVTVR